MEIIQVTYSDGTTGEQVVLPAGDGFTTMPKAVYDAQQVEHLTEIVPSGN